MRILGHRGWPVPAHPENTVAGMSAALEAGADGIEVDVRVTADGVAVCCHDRTLQRVAGVPLAVRDTPWSVLRQVELPGGHRVPLLSEVAALAAGHRQLVLDLKPERRRGVLLRAVLRALADAGTAESEADVVASSFDVGLLDALAARRPQLGRALLTEPDECPRAALRAALDRRDRALHLPLPVVLAEPTVVLDAAEAGVVVRVWTVNRLLDAQLCELLGVEAVVTDEPQLLAAGLRLAALRD